MGIKIGELLYRTREELGIEQKSIYTGICTASNYSNYENDVRIPDFLTLNSILVNKSILFVTSHRKNLGEICNKEIRV